MKKYISILLLFFILNITFTGCNDNSRDSQTTTLLTTLNETSTISQTTEEFKKVTEASTTTSESITTTFTNNSTIYENDQFSIMVPENWTLDESTGIPAFISPDKPIQNISTNFNVMVNSSGDQIFNITKEEYKSQLDNVFSSPIEIKEFTTTTIDNKKVLKVEYIATIENNKCIQTQYHFAKDNACIVYTFTSGNIEKQLPVCEEIFKTLELK